MRKALLSLSALLLTLFLFDQVLGAQTAARGDKGSAPAAKAYSFGLTALTGEDLVGEDRAFLTRFPSLVLAELRQLPPRLESFDYRVEVADRRLLNDRLALGTALQKSLEERSAISLDAALSWYNRGERLGKAEKALAGARSDLESSLEAPAADVPPETDPIELKAAADGSTLLDLKGDDPLRAGRKLGVDFILVGTASPLGAYLEVELHGYDSKLGRQILEWKGYADPKDPSPLAVEFAALLRETLAQSVFGGLEVRVEPPSASIQIDRMDAGSSPLGIYRFEAATLTLDVWAPGYRPFQETLSILPGSTAEKRIELSKAVYGRAKVSTEPADSRLFLDGNETPSGEGLPLSGARDIVVAEAPGYEAGNLILPAQGEADLRLRLRPKDGTTAAGRAEKAKDDFYLALGFVVIGIPLSELALGLRNQYIIAQTVSGRDFGTESAVSTAVFWGAAAATAGLAVNAIWRLLAFISASGP